jgi:uncharacterized protein involved in propanediol utilization
LRKQRKLGFRSSSISAQRPLEEWQSEFALAHIALMQRSGPMPKQYGSLAADICKTAAPVARSWAAVGEYQGTHEQAAG